MPPLSGEVGECLLAGVELPELAGALEPANLGVEGLRVALVSEHLGAITAALVAPTNAPDDTASSLRSLDAHCVAFLLARSCARKLPDRTGLLGRRRRGAGVGGDGSTLLAPNQSSRSCRRTRNREQSRIARRPPRLIAS